MNWDIASLLHTTSGYPLIALICCLIVLEELGIPMPFAPGDFLLVLAGVTISATHVNPLVVIVATYASAFAGAAFGRELFERIGQRAIPWLARFLHAGDRLERMGAKLRRGGSAAVFAGRITPGLRVVTTEVSGLVGLPRRTFLMGLGPAIAVYEGVFIGLGAWLGRSAWATVERYAPKPGQMLLMVALLCIAAIVGQALVSLLLRSDRAKTTLRMLMLG